MYTHLKRYPETEGGGAATNPPAAEPAAEPETEHTADEWRAYCKQNGIALPDLNQRVVGTSRFQHKVLTVAQAREMLTNACAFLNQVVALTSGILETVDAGQLREIVGHDLSIPACVIRRDNTISMKETPAKPEQAPDRDGRKNPRGRKHPLVALIELAAKAAKLLETITAGLTPEALDREPLAERVQARADALEQKREAANNMLFR